MWSVGWFGIVFVCLGRCWTILGLSSLEPIMFVDCYCDYLVWFSSDIGTFRCLGVILGLPGDTFC